MRSLVWILRLVAPAGDQFGPLVQSSVDEVGDAADLRPEPGAGRIVREVNRYEASAVKVVRPAPRRPGDVALRLGQQALGRPPRLEA